MNETVRREAHFWPHNRSGVRAPCRERWVIAGHACVVCGRVRPEGKS